MNWSKWKEEPALVISGIVSAVGTVVACLIAFGVIAWTTEQTVAFTAALAAVLGVVLPLVSGLLIRQQSTSLENPKTSEGEPLIPVSQARQYAAYFVEPGGDTYSPLRPK
jgi:hypothetical protein